MLLVFNPKVTLKETSLPPHGANGVIHLGFEIRPGDYENWKEKLVSNNVRIEKEVTWPGGARSIYFRDPDQNAVELLTTGFWPVD
jgi:catechol 2,3-dioxygenase-like lactoylglutathione lyase family enzyme